MRFYNYLNNITINLSDRDDPDILKDIEDENFLSETIVIIDELNKELNLNKNKMKFRLTSNKSLPKLKIRDQELLAEKWLVYNEKLAKIKKDFLAYSKNLKIS
jgi:hypothetical protein